MKTTCKYNFKIKSVEIHIQDRAWSDECRSSKSSLENIKFIRKHKGARNSNIIMALVILCAQAV